MRCAFYGDDFTGATDTLATYAEAGLASALFLGVPDARRLAASGRLEVLGIAGAARALALQAMADELAPVAAFFRTLDVPLLHYKCCSTFDSAPQVGNLAAAMAALRPAAAHPLVAILGGQPSLGRYCCFGQLFASAGAEGAVHRIDRHPTMSRHPVTPMHEADLRRHLGSQGLARIELVDWRALDDEARLDGVLDAALAQAPDAVLFDVLHERHLATLGRQLWQRAAVARLLAVGASSVAQALLAHWRASGQLAAEAPAAGIATAEGPVFAIAGSRSPVTARQVEHAAAAYVVERVSVQRLLGARETIVEASAQGLAQGRSVLVQVDPADESAASAQAVAQATAQLLAEVLQRAPAVRRVGIAGGDTSSLAARHLGVWGLEFGGRLAAGVTLVRARADAPRLDGLELMLKGGQMGPPELFLTLIDGA